MDLIRAQPGIHKGELQRLTGESWGNLTHHVSVLSRSHRIRCLYVGNRLTMFPAHTSENECHSLAALRRPLARDVVGSLREQPSQQLMALARSLGAPRKRVTSALAALEDAGLVRRNQGSRPEYSLPNELPCIDDSIGLE